MKVNFLGGYVLDVDDRVNRYWGSVREGQIYELDLVNEFFQRLNKNSGEITFLDIGANVGSFAYLPLLNRKIKCLAFEPNVLVCDILKNNIERNFLTDNVTVYNLACSNKVGDVVLKIPKDTTDSGLATLAENPTRFIYDGKDGDYDEQNVSCVTLDGFCSKEKITAIKIDTEGSELDILKGAAKILREQKPMLLLEYDDKNTSMFDYKKEEIQDFLVQFGYNFEIYKRGDLFCE